MKRLTMIGTFLSLVGLLVLTGCASTVRDVTGKNTPADLQADRTDLRDMANSTLQDLYAVQPDARRAIEHAAGYAVFSNLTTKFMVAGSGSGKGIAVNNATRQEVFMGMLQVQAGLGFGIRKFRAIWVFDTQAAFNNFVNQGFEVGGQASLEARASNMGAGYAGAASVSPGVWVYQITKDGLAADLSLQGTKYYRDSQLNQ